LPRLISGGGGNAVISDDSQIVAIAMGNVTGLVWGMQVSAVLMLRLLHVRYFGQKDYLMIKAVVEMHLQLLMIWMACTKPATSGTPDGFTKFGITVQQKSSSWPENIPNGFLAMESKDKGFVITRVQHKSGPTIWRCHC
jgi:hypothetical protein